MNSKTFGRLVHTLALEAVAKGEDVRALMSTAVAAVVVASDEHAKVQEVTFKIRLAIAPGELEIVTRPSATRRDIIEGLETAIPVDDSDEERGTDIRETTIPVEPLASYTADPSTGTLTKDEVQSPSNADDESKGEGKDMTSK